jgi:hypothetical protein
MKWIRSTVMVILMINAIALADDFPAIHGWKSIEEVMYYNPDNLWEYINGAADQFIDYGFQTMSMGEFSAESIAVSIDIYDMGKPLHAFGVYATESRGITERFSIGAEAVIVPPSQCLMFKGKYYVKIYAFEGELSVTSGKDLLQEIASALPGTNAMPAELDLLPIKGRIEGSQGYTKVGYLGLSELKNCAYATFKECDGQEFQYYKIIPSADETEKDILSNLGENWHKMDIDEYPVYYRTIPYQGMTGLVLTAAGIFGVTDAQDREILLQRIKIFIP